MWFTAEVPLMCQQQVSAGKPQLWPGTRAGEIPARSPKHVAGHSQPPGRGYVCPVVEFAKPSMPLKKKDVTPGSSVSFCFPVKTDVNLLRSKLAELG